MSGRDGVLEQLDVEQATLIAWLNPLNKPLRHKLGLLGLLALAVLPVLLRPVTALTISSAFFFAMFVMSWDAVSGYTGQISFGHSVFFTVGAYTTTMLNMGHGLPPLVSIPVGVVLAALAGLIIGLPTLRLRGPYFSLVTIIVPVILLNVFIFFSDIFGGQQGLSSPETLLGLGVTDSIVLYYLSFAVFLLVLIVLLAVTRSDAGRVFTAIRESEDAVSSAGLNPAKFKIFAFVLSAAVGGLAGAVLVHTPRGAVTPDTLLVLTVNIEIIIAAIIGGMGTIVGAAVGGLFFYMARDFLREAAFTVPGIGAEVGDVNVVVFTLIMLLILYFLPIGLVRGGIIAGRKVLSKTGVNVATDGGRPTEPANPVRRVLRNWREAWGGDDDER
jgi:branched-chain amino acid transport system permease protein